jgi:hypothetical protein
VNDYTDDRAWLEAEYISQHLLGSMPHMRTFFGFERMNTKRSCGILNLAYFWKVIGEVLTIVKYYYYIVVHKLNNNHTT